MEAMVISLLTVAGKKIIYEILEETYELIKGSIKNPKVNNVLAEMDLIADLKVIEVLVGDVTVSEEKEGVVDAVDTALANVKDSLLVIKEEMRIIKDHLDDHERRFFASFFEPNVTENLENIAKQKVILDKRVDLLIKLLAIKRELDGECERRRFPDCDCQGECKCTTDCGCENGCECLKNQCVRFPDCDCQGECKCTTDCGCENGCECLKNQSMCSPVLTSSTVDFTFPILRERKSAAISKEIV